MNIFKKNELNPFNIGDKFKMEVEIIKIEKEKNNIMYVLITPTLSYQSNIYAVSCQDIMKMEKL